MIGLILALLYFITILITGQTPKAAFLKTNDFLYSWYLITTVLMLGYGLLLLLAERSFNPSVTFRFVIKRSLMLLGSFILTNGGNFLAFWPKLLISITLIAVGIIISPFKD